MPKNSKARIDANRRYAEKAYDRLYPFVPKGRKAEIQAAADAQRESLNDFIVTAIDERMERLSRDVKESFIPPDGEWCSESCPKRGEVFPAIEVGRPLKHDYAESGYPWCSEYGVEITNHDEKTGRYRKCDECLRKCGEKE